jgi:hypothetical protein
MRGSVKDVPGRFVKDVMRLDTKPAKGQGTADKNTGKSAGATRALSALHPCPSPLIAATRVLLLS